MENLIDIEMNLDKNALFVKIFITEKKILSNCFVILIMIQIILVYFGLVKNAILKTKEIKKMKYVLIVENFWLISQN